MASSEAARCGWCGGYEDELADPHGPCPEAIDYDPVTDEPYIIGPHQYVREVAARRPGGEGDS